jgi:hypothetical protein
MKFEKNAEIRENHEFRATLTQFNAIWSLFCGTLTLTLNF